mgnify:FL=1
MNQPKTVKLTDIAEIERCRSGAKYPAGTCYIQVSACAKNSVEKWHITDKDTELSGKYAAVLPKVPAVPEYLREALEYSADEFFCRYVGSNINIQMDMFKDYTLLFHESTNDQRTCVEMLAPITRDIENTANEIMLWENLKQYFLANLFV